MKMQILNIRQIVRSKQIALEKKLSIFFSLCVVLAAFSIVDGQGLSFTYQGKRSKWPCPPTWLQTAKTQIMAMRNSTA